MTSAENSDGLWVPKKASQDQAYYFIDANRAYRGPISKRTLHYLFNTQAISRNTYVFTEELTETRQWIRIRKLPTLLEELQRPLPSAELGVEHQPMPPPAYQPGLAQSAGATSLSDSSSGVARGEASLDASAPLVNDSPMVATPRHNISMSPANLNSGGQCSAAGCGNSACGGSNRTKLFPQFARCPPPRISRKFPWSRPPPKFKFGQPISAVPLQNGVPEVLVQLRAQLWDSKGYRLEGIFRVSPMGSQLKLTRQMAEAGQFDKISDMESVAQLIKQWFRELPESIFGPSLEAVIDGDFTSGEQADHIVSQLPERNRATIYWLLHLIFDICRYEDDNRMTAQSMTIVFAPNLVFAPESISPLDALELNKRVVHFTELLFSHWNLAEGGRRRATVSQ